ncbi:MAG: hypothetical protein RLO51_15040 [Thalassobaculum sp.]|uniref:tetratricopeptide repeat protein n=1 Tax=Thalassobaculum sp. TaxID=2022740 RepID=UPI0032EE70A6
MDLQEVSSWEEVAIRLETDRRAPSADPGLSGRWAARTPDLESLIRLIRLEHRFGSALLAMDLACWALEAVADRPEVRILASAAAAKAGLHRTARRLLRPLLRRHDDGALARSVMVAWRDQALASGRMIDLKQALVIAPATAAGTVRLADELWEMKRQDEALTAYRRAIPCGTLAIKAYLRMSWPVRDGRRPEVLIEILRAALGRTGDASLRARLLVLLHHADRRADALALLGEGPLERIDVEEVREARSALIAYARAQLEAVAEEEHAPRDTSKDRVGGDSSARRQRSLKAGRALAGSGWTGPAIWQLRKAAEGSEKS